MIISLYIIFRNLSVFKTSKEFDIDRVLQVLHTEMFVNYSCEILVLQCKLNQWNGWLFYSANVWLPITEWILLNGCDGTQAKRHQTTSASCECYRWSICACVNGILQCSHTPALYLLSLLLSFTTHPQVNIYFMHSRSSFFVFLALPIEAANSNPLTVLAVTKHGGHFGFMEGISPRGPSWMNRVCRQFLSAVKHSLWTSCHR